MKLSIAFASATILSLAFMPCSECQFGFDNLINKTSAIIDVGAKSTTGIAEKVTDFMPTPAGILTLSKDALLGLPMELLMTCIDRMCSLALAANNSTKPYKQPKIEEMNYFLMTNDENISIPITDSKQLWLHPKFDKNKKVVVMVTGWNSDIKEESSAASALWTAYKTRNDTNFVLIDTARYIDTLYAYSAFNTMDLGVGLATGLAELMRIIPLDRIHVMGHSLGAHIVGQAGKTFQELTDKLLPRITGFDPAKPCFKEGESLQGLGRGDAEFVDIIHSDSGGLGKKEPIGDADFYPNGAVPLMPGCLTIFCSHSRAWEYFAESVVKGQENSFIAKKCSSMYSYSINACIRKEIPMGYACPKTAKGNFFLKTKGSAPFGITQK